MKRPVLRGMRTVGREVGDMQQSGIERPLGLLGPESSFASAALAWDVSVAADAAARRPADGGDSFTAVAWPRALALADGGLDFLGGDDAPEWAPFMASPADRWVLCALLATAASLGIDPARYIAPRPAGMLSCRAFLDARAGRDRAAALSRWVRAVMSQVRATPFGRALADSWTSGRRTA